MEIVERTVNSAIEVYAFQAEVVELLEHLVNTYYTNSEDFLRELAINASNALDKIRKVVVDNPAQLRNGHEFNIHIIPNKTENTLTVMDTGIGMTKRDLITNLGTISKPSTKTFINALRNGANLNKLHKFSIGFFAAYLVAKKVTVYTKHNCDKPYIWESTGNGEFILKVDIKNTIKRGTKIVLEMKPDFTKFLDESDLKDIIKEFARFIVYPVILKIEKERIIGIEEQITFAPPEHILKIEGIQEYRNGLWRASRTSRKVKYNDIKCLNEVQPLWLRDPQGITQKTYADFYHILTKDYEDHFIVHHFHVDWPVQFQVLLYIPRRAPSQFMQQPHRQSHIKLYVAHMLHMDNVFGVLPDYLCFLCGVIDCAKLPLDAPTLEQSREMKVIRKIVTERMIELLEQLKSNVEEYKKFYLQYAKYLKLGIVEDEEFRQRLSDLLLFRTSHAPLKFSSLKQYMARFKPKQPGIYCLNEESLRRAIQSPTTERAEMLSYEVIYMLKPLDEFILHFMKNYKGTPFIMCNKENIVFPETRAIHMQYLADRCHYTLLIKEMQQILAKRVEKIIVSKRLFRTPSCVVSTQYAITAGQQRVIAGQAFYDKNYTFIERNGDGKVLELNPRSPLMKALCRKIFWHKWNNEIKNYIHLMYDVAMLSSGYSLPHPGVYEMRVHRLIEEYLNLKPKLDPNKFCERMRTLEMQQY